MRQSNTRFHRANGPHRDRWYTIIQQCAFRLDTVNVYHMLFHVIFLEDKPETRPSGQVPVRSARAVVELNSAGWISTVEGLRKLIAEPAIWGN